MNEIVNFENGVWFTVAFLFCYFESKIWWITFFCIFKAQYSVYCEMFFPVKKYHFISFWLFNLITFSSQQKTRHFFSKFNHYFIIHNKKVQKSIDFKQIFDEKQLLNISTIFFKSFLLKKGMSKFPWTKDFHKKVHIKKV